MLVRLRVSFDPAVGGGAEVSVLHGRPTAVTHRMECPALGTRAGRIAQDPAVPWAGPAVCLWPEMIIVLTFHIFSFVDPWRLE